MRQNQSSLDKDSNIVWYIQNLFVKYKHTALRLSFKKYNFHITIL